MREEEMRPTRFQTLKAQQLGVASKMLRNELTRRNFIKSCAVAGIAPTLLGLTGRKGWAEAREIILSNWGGDSGKAQEQVFALPYTEKTGIPIHVDTSPLEGRIKAMVDAGNVIWDVMDIDNFSAIKLGKEGYLRPIDYSIVNRDTVPGTSFDHGVAAYVMSYVIAYDKSKFPDGPPQTWADFWDVERFPGKRALYKWLTGALDAALLADGVSKEQVYPIDIPRALAKIEQIKDHLVYWDSGAESQQLLRNGDVSMACIWSSRAFALEKETEGRITFHWNEAVAYGDTWSVPKDNPAGDLVWPFIASMQDVDKQIGLLAVNAAGPVTTEANGQVPNDLRRLNPTDPENWKLQVLMDAQWWSENYDDALAAYTDLIAG
ncbi:ABC transporter substrate-binding protein [Mesorhizobium sp. KR1-2]|uniref:ABC transporter substrate-binding protein n=1 Tax=Mesorhizobium sp. KR1-2 TaxID=3156609 RepID=UPI0032B424E6